MDKVIAKHVGDMESIYGGLMVRVRAELGVTSFGMQVINLPPANEKYPTHDEADSGQEEVYVALTGSAELLVGDDVHELKPGVFIRVAPGTARKVVTKDEGVSMLVIGGVPGHAFRPSPWSELGAPPPM